MHNCPSCGTAIAGRVKYCDDCRDTAAPWRVNHDNIDIACDYLDIDVPVYIRRAATRELLGRYHGIKLRDNAPRDMEVVSQMTDDELNSFMYHKITISTRLTPEAASRALWHELTHAAQYQRDPDYYVEQYAKELKQARAIAASGVMPFTKAYRLISFEIEAKANEELHYTMCSLTLANKRANMPALKRPHNRIDSVVNGAITPGDRAELFERLAKQSIETAKTMLAASL